MESPRPFQSLPPGAIVSSLSGGCNCGCNSWLHFGTILGVVVIVNLTIKNVPNDIYEQLKQAAFKHGRSLNAEVIRVLAAEVAEAERRQQMRDSRKEVERFVASLPRMSSSAPLIREDRER